MYIKNYLFSVQSQPYQNMCTGPKSLIVDRNQSTTSQFVLERIHNIILSYISLRICKFPCFVSSKFCNGMVLEKLQIATLNCIGLFYIQGRLFLTDPGEARGCSINSLVINWFINSFIQSAFSSHSFTVPPRPNGIR